MKALLGAFACAMLLSSPATAQEAVVESGKKLYTRYCSSCHGPTGQGDGLVAGALKSPPPDLTKIAARRKGAFPEAELAELIDGRREVKAHGAREMPVWGEWLAAEESPPLREKQKESITAARIRFLLAYLKSIQKG